MASQPSSSATDQPEKFNILDPAMLLRMRERALRWHLAHRKLARISPWNSEKHAFACIAATIDLCAGDAIAAQTYSLEAEIARGATLNRIMAAFAKKTRPASVSTNVAAAVALASGLAGRAEASSHKPPTNRKQSLSVVVALIEGQIDASSHPTLRLASRRKLPLVLVALNGAFSEASGQSSDAYELYRFPRIPVDANDPIAIYRVAHEGVDRARIGYGLTLVDCVDWPFPGSDGPLESLERRIMAAEDGPPMPHRSAIEQQLAAELEQSTAAEPGVMLFAPE